MEIAFQGFPVFRSIKVQDTSQPGEARRAAAVLASDLSFDEVKQGQVEIIVTELARNIAIHGGGGVLVLAAWRQEQQTRIDILAMDKGSGISDVGRALEDGFSTAGTPGTGMGAASRLASGFDIFTQQTKGTAVLARVSNQPKGRFPLCVGAVSIPVAGEQVCGDAFASAQSSSRSIFMVVDGLGHGPLAAEAATEAVATFDRWKSDPAKEIISRLHDALKKTRGAAAAVAEVHHDRGILTYCGVGNIAGVIVSAIGGPSRSMVSHNGIVGHQAPRVTEFTYPWDSSSTLVMHSDGINTHWNLQSYPGLLSKDPALIAGVLYRDQTRSRDDSTVLVARAHASKAA